MSLSKTTVHSILVIDDDMDDYELIAEAVKDIEPDVTVSYFNSCEQAKIEDSISFDLVFLDINMPKEDGFHWLKSIRKMGNKQLPVVVYTNSMSDINISRAYNEGANLYFSKPENYNLLLKGLKQIIEMDWSDPVSITQKYFQNGKYSTFELSR